MGRAAKLRQRREGAPRQEGERTPPSSPRWLTAVAGLLIVVAGVVCYRNALDVPFVFDDIPSIEENASIQHLWPPWLPLSPPSGGESVQSRPLVNLSLAVNYTLGELRPRGYHGFNLAVHLLAALTLFGLVRRTLDLPRMPRPLAGRSTPLALAVALIWTVHPLQTSVVTPVVERTESMMGLFFLVTLYCVSRGASSPYPWRWYGGATAACAAGMACKEVMVTAPLIALLYDRAYLSGSFRESLRRRWRLYLALASTWLVLTALLLSSGGKRATAAGFGFGVTSWEYARTQVRAVIHYLRLCFWPHPLVLDYGMAVARTGAKVLPYAVLIAILLGLTAAAWRAMPRAGFLGAFFFVVLAPSSSVVPLVAQTAAEKRMYLPLAAVVVLVIVAAAVAWERIAAQGMSANGGLARALPVLVLAGVVVALGLVTINRNLDYRSPLAIWEVTVRDCPDNPRARTALSRELRFAGDLTRAVAEASMAIQLEPNFIFGYVNRARAHELAGGFEDAVRDYGKVVELDPGNENGLLFPALSSRGKLEARLGRYDQAFADLGKAIQLKPDSVEVYVNRGNVLALMGRNREAISDYAAALRLRPDDPDVYANRALAYYNVRDYERAWADVRECQRLGRNPDPQFLSLLESASPRKP